MPSVERHLTIVNNLGLHVRPAARIATTAMQFRSDIRIARDRNEVNAKSSIDLLTLAAVSGTVLTLRANGDDAEAAVEAIAQLVESRFGEE